MPFQSEHQNSHRSDIQALRALAVIAVILYHASELHFPNGYLGVDVFFVISGFLIFPLITQAVSGKNTNSIWGFYKRRIFRLLPALGIVIVFTSFVGFFFVNVSEHERIFSQGIASLLLAGNIGAYRYSGDYFHPTPNPLIHTWSLGVEEQIYVFLPLLILLVAKMKKSFQMAAIILCCLGSLFLFQFGLNLYTFSGFKFLENPTDFLFYSPLSRFWQFSFGGLISYIAISDIRISLPKKRKIKYATVICLTTLLLIRIPVSESINSIIVSTLSGIILCLGTPSDMPNRFTKPLIWLGDRSYSIYLFHMPLMYVAKFAPIFQSNYAFWRYVPIPIAIFLTITFAAMNYSLVESKWRVLGRERKESNSINIKVLTSFALLPIVINVLLQVSVHNSYWMSSLGKSVPVSASHLDLNCDRDSQFGAPCEYSQPSSKKTLLLIGDSHATHFSQTIVDLGLESEWKVFI